MDVEGIGETDVQQWSSRGGWRLCGLCGVILGLNNGTLFHVSLFHSEKILFVLVMNCKATNHKVRPYVYKLKL